MCATKLLSFFLINHFPSFVGFCGLKDANPKVREIFERVKKILNPDKSVVSIGVGE
jgi:hypothetical protein